MKLIDALVLAITAAQLAPLVGVSERQIRKMRQGIRDAPDMELDEDLLQTLILQNEENNAETKAREAWYLVEAKLLHILRDSEDHFKQIKMIPHQTAEMKQQIKQELDRLDKRIKEILAERSEVVKAAKVFGIVAIFNPREDELQKLLGKHVANMKGQEKPSDALKRRVQQERISHVSSVPQVPEAVPV